MCIIEFFRDLLAGHPALLEGEKRDLFTGGTNPMDQPYGTTSMPYPHPSNQPQLSGDVEVPSFVSQPADTPRRDGESGNSRTDGHNDSTISNVDSESDRSNANSLTSETKSGTSEAESDRSDVNSAASGANSKTSEAERQGSKAKLTCCSERNHNPLDQYRNPNNDPDADDGAVPVASASSSDRKSSNASVIGITDDNLKQQNSPEASPDPTALAEPSSAERHNLPEERNSPTPPRSDPSNQLLDPLTVIKILSTIKRLFLGPPTSRQISSFSTKLLSLVAIPPSLCSTSPSTF
jgi:hypothetical protein